MKVNELNLQVSRASASLNIASPSSPSRSGLPKDSYILSGPPEDFFARLRPARNRPPVPRPRPAPTPAPGPSETQCPEGLPPGFWNGELQVDAQHHPLIVTRVDGRSGEQVLQQLRVCNATPMVAFRHTVLGSSYWLILPRTQFPAVYSQACDGRMHFYRLVGAGPILTIPHTPTCLPLQEFEARGVVLSN